MHSNGGTVHSNSSTELSTAHMHSACIMLAHMDTLRMDRERAELDDRTAKRRRFNADTDDGMTFRSILDKAAMDAKDFQSKAKQLSLGLEVYKAFKEHVAGNHRPLQYNAEAAEDIARFITESVNAASKDTTRDLRQYFNAIPRQQAAPMDTGDLYDN